MPTQISKQPVDNVSRVYLELRGGRQPGLDFVAPAAFAVEVARIVRAPRPHEPSAEELAAHLAMLKMIREPLWQVEG